MSDTNNGRGISSGKLFKDLYKGRDLKVLPFIPLVHELAAKVGQSDSRAIWDDPAAMVNSLLSVKELCGFNALTTSINLAGWQLDNSSGGDIKNLFQLTKHRSVVGLDVIQRLKHMLKGNAVMGCLSAGPIAISVTDGSCTGEVGGENFSAARNQLLDIVKSMGESRIDFFMIYEKGSDLPDTAVTEYLEEMRPLWNALRYYDVQPLFALHDAPPQLIESLASEVSGIAFTGNFFELDLAWLSRISEQKRVCMGLPLPEEVFKGSMDVLETILSQVKEHFNGRRFFLVPSGEIPGETEIKVIQDFMEMLR